MTMKLADEIVPKPKIDRSSQPIRHDGGEVFAKATAAEALSGRHSPFPFDDRHAACVRAPNRQRSCHRSSIGPSTQNRAMHNERYP